MTHDEMIAVLEAHRDGIPLEYRTSGKTGPEPPGEWMDYNLGMLAFCGPWDMRIKPNSEVEPDGREETRP